MSFGTSQLRIREKSQGAVREQWFLATNPEWAGKTKRLLDIYLTCQERALDGKGPELDAALAHVRSCSWCKHQLASPQ
jgi:hypothetical protein